MEKDKIMGLYTVKVYGIELDVYADVEVERDPLGTGDSPAATYVDIIAIELADSAIDITTLLSDGVLEKIGAQVQEEAKNEL
jgi:nitrogen regulatory protein PII-like uncharacterized protein